METPRIVDKELLRRRLDRALSRAAPGAGFLMDHVVRDLAERLAAVERRFERGVAFGGNTERLALALAGSGRVETVFRLERTSQALAAGTGAVADEEALPLADESIDLFASALALQWTNDLPGALAQIRRALRPDGLLLAAFAGGSTLHELRDALMTAETDLRGGASPRILPFADLREIGALLQRAGFALPVVDRDVLKVRYDTAFQLFADLRAMGAGNVLVDRDRTPATRALFLRTAEIYAERHSDPDGRIRATFEIVSISGWAPHESQQKPARRGSATVSLASVLGSRSRERPS
jgi:SAM-dependent methyltransferase